MFLYAISETKHLQCNLCKICIFIIVEKKPVKSISIFKHNVCIQIMNTILCETLNLVNSFNNFNIYSYL